MSYTNRSALYLLVASLVLGTLMYLGVVLGTVLRELPDTLRANSPVHYELEAGRE